MQTVVTAHFHDRSTAGQAVEDLCREGFPRDSTVTYYLTPSGQHDHHPLEAQQDSPGSDQAAAGAAFGALAGGAVGVAVGLAGLPLLGASASMATAGLGAYVGSLYGALETMHDAPRQGAGTTSAVSPGSARPRQSGMLVAVSAPAATQQHAAIRIFKALGASEIDRPQGEIVGGEWLDFDPLAPLTVVGSDA